MNDTVTPVCVYFIMTLTHLDGRTQRNNRPLLYMSDHSSHSLAASLTFTRPEAQPLHQSAQRVEMVEMLLELKPHDQLLRERSRNINGN